MTPEERAYFARVISINAEVVNAEKGRINAVKAEAVQKALNRGKLTVEEIAEDNSVSINFVLEIQRQIPNP